MTEFNTEWDIEKYKQDHEIDEHWELKKGFLLAHKDRFPEDELVCLAQVFVNVELLGCRYPEETMKLVAELSKDVADEFRNRRKTKLQRTFVQASDAASSKVKGLKNTPNTSMNQSQSSMDESFEDRRTGKKEKRRLQETCNESDNEDISNNYRCSKKQKNEPVSPYGRMILFDYAGDAPQGVLTRAANAYGINIEWKYNEESHCSVYMNNKMVAESTIPNKKQSKTEAATRAVEELKKYYYTIKVTQPTSTDTETVSCNSMRSEPEKKSVVESNIGNKLMKLMGWAGGGLGKKQQGIVEPVSVEPQMCREGLGLHSKKSDLMKLKKKCKELISDFLKSDSKQDLIFSSDFTKEERATMHQVAKQMGVKSHSHGPPSNRRLIFTKKIDPDELIDELKAIGGKIGKYELISPTGQQ